MWSLLVLAVTICVTIAQKSTYEYASSSVSKTYKSSSKVTLSMDLSISAEDNLVTLTLLGPSSVYYAVGFGNTRMDGTYCVVIDGDDGSVQERVLDGKTAGDELDLTWSIESNEVNGNDRTVVLTREYDLDYDSLSSSKYFQFDTSDSKLKTIWAYGKTSSLDNHGEDKRGDKKLSMSRVKATATNNEVKILDEMVDEEVVQYDGWYNYYSGYMTTTSVFTWLTCLALFVGIGWYAYRKYQQSQYEKIPDGCNANISMVNLGNNNNNGNKSQYVDIDNEQFTVV